MERDVSQPLKYFMTQKTKYFIKNKNKVESRLHLFKILKKASMSRIMASSANIFTIPMKDGI